jgi:hypothetical protein
MSNGQRTEQYADRGSIGLRNAVGQPGEPDEIADAIRFLG